MFSNSIPALTGKISVYYAHLQQRLLENFQISIAQQADIINQTATSNTQILSQAVGGIYSILILVLLIPFYVFLLLFYKPLLLQFIFDVSGKGETKEISEIL